LEDPQSTGFDWLKSVLDAERTRYVRGSIYELDPRQLGVFDVVLCFGVIYHLRYPVLGLDNLRRVATDDLYLESHVLDETVVNFDDGSHATLASLAPWVEKSMLMQFYPTSELLSDRSNWWAPSAFALKAIMETGGFAVDHVLVGGYRGYFHAKVKPGMPEFLERVNDAHTYEDQFYALNLAHLFGPKEGWRR
jgi:tRNA (mo5U34)-methyltransferase